MLSGSELFSKTKNPTSIVILLHGYGDDGEGFLGLAQELQKFLPETHFLSPDGIDQFENASFGRQWCSLNDRAEPALVQGLKAAEPYVNEFIEYQLQRFSLADNRLVLVGFSQGAMLALHVALRRLVPMAGVIGLSGMLVAPHLLRTELKSKPLIALIHGMFDEVIPVAAMYRTVEALKAENIAAETLIESGGHSIGQGGLNFTAQLLKRYLNY